MDCVDLKALVGKKFRLGRDPAYGAQYGKRSRVEDPWLLIIPCKYGEIYPPGKETLAFSSNGRGPVAKRVAALDGAKVLNCRW